MLRIPYALSVYDDKEIQAVAAVLREHRSNMGIETQNFEKNIAKLFGKNYGVMVNSGSSANFLAIELLNFPVGSEIITPLLTFSTTIAPLVQHGLIPVFADVLPEKYIINVDQVESLISSKTKAIMILWSDDSMVKLLPVPTPNWKAGVVEATPTLLLVESTFRVLVSTVKSPVLVILPLLEIV